MTRCRWAGQRHRLSCAGDLGYHRVDRDRQRLSLSHVRCRAPKPVAAITTAPVLGFNAYTTPQTVALQRQVGVTATRLFVSWSGVEPSPGVWDWASSDQSYQEILAGGLQPLIVAFAAPCWAAAEPCSTAYASPPDSANDPAWIIYIHDLVERYPQAIGIEIWSEPNLTSNFYPSPSPVRYVQLLKEAYQAVKAVNPKMPVISGGLLMDDGTGTGAGGEASSTYLAAMYAAGAGSWMNVLGIHIYPENPAQGSSPAVWDTAAMTRWLEQVRRVRQAADAAPEPIWITEMGVSTSSEPGFPVALTPQQQADDLVTMVQMARADPLVVGAMIDTLQDARPNALENLLSNLSGPLDGNDIYFNEVNQGFGIFTDTLAPKPAACALSQTLGGSVPCG